MRINIWTIFLLLLYENKTFDNMHNILIKARHKRWNTVVFFLNFISVVYFQQITRVLVIVFMAFISLCVIDRSLGINKTYKTLKLVYLLNFTLKPTEIYELLTSFPILKEFYSNLSCLMTKPTKWHVRPAKTQFSLGIRPVFAQISLGIRPVFAGRTLTLLVLSCCGLYVVIIF